MKKGKKRWEKKTWTRMKEGKMMKGHNMDRIKKKKIRNKSLVNKENEVRYKIIYVVWEVDIINSWSITSLRNGP